MPTTIFHDPTTITTTNFLFFFFFYLYIPPTVRSLYTDDVFSMHEPTPRSRNSICCQNNHEAHLMR